MIVIIDNYDSFTYNLYQYIGEWNPDIQVFKNDAITIEQLKALPIQKIILSPGPGRPKESGITLDVIGHFGDKVPILGVCLGHQAIAEAFGGRVVEAERIMHGKTSSIFHNKDILFEDIESPFTAMRYHSLIVDKYSVPHCLEVIAVDKQDEIMALKHRKYPIYGVQFHPESIGTKVGLQILKNFLYLNERRL